MKFKTRREALASVKERKRVVGGKKVVSYDAYLGTDPITKSVKRMYDSDRQRLVQRIEEFYSALDHHGDIGSLLTPAQIIDARAAYDLLDGAKMNTTLREAIHLFIDHAREAAEISSKPLGEAYDEYLSSFGPLQYKHIASVKYRVGKWAAAYGLDKPVSEVRAADIVSFLDRKHASSPKTWNNCLVYIRSFLSWCCASMRGYAVRNVLADVKTKSIEWKEPEYVTPDVMERIVRILEGDVAEHPERLAYIVLNAFCGIRREEIIRMAKMPDAARVSLVDETIRIGKPKGYQKGIRPRAFHIPANALAWMKSFDFAWGLARVNPHTSDRISAVAKDNGIRYVHNAGRHSFITMHCAAYGDPAKTEAIVGTSSAMRAAHYMGLASKAEGEAYFSIFPTDRSSR